MPHAAVIYAKDLSRMVEFYSRLGLVVDETVAGEYVVLQRDGLELSIVQTPLQLAAQIEIADPPQPRERTPIKLAFAVPSIDATLAATGALGGRLKPGAGRWQFRGHTVQDAVDPEGNVYQLRESLCLARAALA